MKTTEHSWSVSLICSYNEKCFRQKMYGQLKHTFHVQYLFFPRKSWRLWDNMKNKIFWSGTGHRWEYGACVLHAGYLSYKHTLRICNTYCFSTTTMVARTRLNVTLYVRCLPCWLSECHTVWRYCTYVNLIYTHKKSGKWSTELRAVFYADVHLNDAVIVERKERSSLSIPPKLWF